MADGLPSHARVVVIGRRHRRLQRRLPPHQARLDGRAAPGATGDLVRHDVARGRPRRPAPRHPQPDPARQVRGGSLRGARGRDRPGHGVPPTGKHQRGAHGRADGRAEALGIDGAVLRRRRRGDHAVRGGTPLAAHAHRRPGRGLWLPRTGGRSHRHHAGPGREAPAGGATIVENAGQSPRFTGARARSPGVGAPPRGDVACEVVVELRRHVGAPARPARRGRRAPARLRALLHRDRPAARGDANLPVLRDTDGCIYVREEVEAS